jgi:hypothetical protein
MTFEFPPKHSFIICRIVLALNENVIRLHFALASSLYPHALPIFDWVKLAAHARPANALKGYFFGPRHLV